MLINGALWVLGGYYRGALKSTEYIHANGKVVAGPNLPSPRSLHCMVALSSSSVIILWGYNSKSGSKSAIIYDSIANTFTISTPSMNYDRTNAGCTLIKNSPMHENRPVVLVVGGFEQVPAEVYDYTQPNASWQQSIRLFKFFFSFVLKSKDNTITRITLHCQSQCCRG